MKYIIASSLALFSLIGWVAPSNALTVSSQDCSGIDATDGNTEDWSGIPYLIETADTVVGTTYYLDSATEEWTTTEPSDWQYSANLDQQANIQEMKMCNTDIMQLMLRTEEPMMNFYDRDNDNYTSFFTSYGEEQERNTFTMPADYHYWMVWKMQAADGSGGIIYLAANLEMDAGMDFGSQDAQNDIPQLFLYEESDVSVAFDEASFDANVDTQLVQIELSQESEDDCDSTTGEGCESPTVEKTDLAFEVSQDISELFNYADFAYGDTINISAAMYNSDAFAVASLSPAALDETATEQYTFSKKAVTNLRAPERDRTASSIRMRWNRMDNVSGYQVRLINPDTDAVIDRFNGIDGTGYTITDLTADTSYRVIVRAVTRRHGHKTFSAWSSGFKWTTDSE